MQEGRRLRSAKLDRREYEEKRNLEKRRSALRNHGVSGNSDDVVA